MGLLDRAGKMRDRSAENLTEKGEGARAPEEPKKASRLTGLFKRAKTHRLAEEFDRVKDQKGLRKRAKEQRLAEELDRVKDRKGLLKRAKEQRHAEEPEPVGDRGGLLKRARDQRLAEQLDLVGDREGLLKRAETMRSEEESETAPISPIRTPEPISPESPIPSEATEEGEPFHFEYEGNSPPEMDLTSDEIDRGESPVEPPSEDPFDRWFAEAQTEAENLATGVLQKSETLEERPFDPFLFERNASFSTVPAGLEQIAKRRSETYQNLLSELKEIASIDSYEGLEDALLFSLLGEVGCESACIFANYEEKKGGGIFYPVAHSGFELPENWALKPGDPIHDDLCANPETKYGDYYRSRRVSDVESDILQRVPVSHFIPIVDGKEVHGVIALGPSLSGEDYTLSDFEFLDQLSEMTAIALHQLASKVAVKKEMDELKRSNEMHSSIAALTKKSSTARSIDDLFDILSRNLERDFDVLSYSLVLLSTSDQKYRIFSGNRISPQSMERFAVDPSSELIGMVSNLTRVYDFQDFLENKELIASYSWDDLQIMRHYWIVPLIHLNWLVGFITIHETGRPWTNFEREFIVYLAEVMAPIFATHLVVRERESLFRDPFSPVELRLKKEIEKARSYDTSVSFAVIRIKNIRRLITLNGAEKVIDLISEYGKIISRFLYETDFMARTGQGKYAIILPGKNRDQTAILLKKIKNECGRSRILASSPIQVQFSDEIISFPDDTEDYEKMLAMID